MLAFYDFYVRAFAVALPLLAVAIGIYGASKAALPPHQMVIFVAISAAVFGGWYALAVPLSQSGIFNVPAQLGDPPYVLMFLFGGSFLVWALAWFTPLGRKLTTATPLSAIAAFQIPRIMGGLFLIGWMANEIPALFAIPAGLGDIWAGIAGWQASKALASGAPEGRRLLARANLIGMVDFAFAVILGIITSQGFAQLFYHNSPNIINDHPLAFFPAYFVPIFLGFHFIAISRMRQERKLEGA